MYFSCTVSETWRIIPRKLRIAWIHSQPHYTRLEASLCLMGSVVGTGGQFTFNVRGGKSRLRL